MAEALLMATKFQRHVMKWKNCELCSLCKTRKNVVLYKGKVPCDILFIGEAPGVSEDILGHPFEGPAGSLLQEWIDRARAYAEVPNLRIGFTNVIACIPVEEIEGERGSKSKAPPKASIKACAPRLKEIIQIAHPKTIVAVGKYADQSVKAGELTSIQEKISIIHPAAVLRMEDPPMRRLTEKRVQVTLNSLFEKYFGVDS